MTSIRLTTLGALVFVAGCSFDEGGLIVEDMTGKVVVTEEAATCQDADGNDITDVRCIGPVVLGLYPSIDRLSFEYPHPELGPQFDAGQVGDAYPYGGTTVGDFKFACAEALNCKVVSGRHLSWDALLDWFEETWGQELLNDDGAPIENGAQLQQQCFEYMAVTSDEEINAIQWDDRNEDGVVDENDLMFVQNADGDFEADFTIYQQEFFSDEETGQGFSLWGWMDAPADVLATYSTCTDDSDYNGFDVDYYNIDYTGPVQYPELLNFPSDYIDEGDYVSSAEHVYETAYDTGVVITIDLPVED